MESYPMFMDMKAQNYQDGSSSHFSLILTCKHFSSVFREKGRERKINVREKNRLAASLMLLDPG